MQKLTLVLTLTLLNMTTYAQEKTPSNKHFWYSLETTASAATIWNIWTDVPSWKEWDSGLKDASIMEDFSYKAKGTIISLEGRKSRFKVIEFEQGRSYTIKTVLPLGSLCVKRSLSSQNGKTLFTHEVWFSGLTGGIFAKAFGAKFREMLPEVLENIKRKAEGS